MKMLQGFAFFVMIALVPAIAIAQSASGISAKVEKVDETKRPGHAGSFSGPL